MSASAPPPVPDFGAERSVLGERMSTELALIEGQFTAELASDLACVNQLAEHVARYRGKMLRPRLLLATAWALAGPDGYTAHAETCRTLATVVEMVHMSTLVHDDILDEAEVRRHGQTVNHLRGNETAVMLGDYLISHAYHLCSGLGMPPGTRGPLAESFSRVVARTTNTVCEGELLQLSCREFWELDRRTYFEIIRRKTAALTGVCCKLPALIWPTAESGEAIEDFGVKLGMAFQVIDDVLDLTGQTASVGKTLGTDLEKGKLTLPLILLVEEADAATRAQVLQDLQTAASPSSPEADRQEARQRLRDRLAEGSAMQGARDWALEAVEQAVAALERTLPPTPERALLASMAHQAVNRRY